MPRWQIGGPSAIAMHGVVPLLTLTRRPDIMGTFANRRVTNVTALLGTVVMLALNLFLILEAFGVSILGLS